MTELYEFTMGDTVYRYCSGASNVTHEGNVFTAEAITRGEINDDVDAFEGSIVMPRDLQPAPLFLITNPAQIIHVTILKENGTKIFMGEIDSVTFDTDNGSVKVKLTSIQSAFKSKIPRRTFGTACSFELFDENCALQKEVYRLEISDGTLNATRTQLTSADLALKEDGYFAGGYVENGFEYNYIISHTSSTITTLYPFIADPVNVYVYPGCEKTLSACREKFDNEKSYGGFPFVPQKNPYSEGF